MAGLERILNVPASRPLWFEAAPARKALDGGADVDVAIIGAGYTGLWAAYYLLLADPTIRIAILEREVVGFGASGRNGGWASAIFPISLERVAKMHSHEAALHLQQVMNDTVDEVGRVISAEGIDADYVKGGFLSLARTPAQLVRVKAAVDGAKRFGLPGQWREMDREEASGHVGATPILGGLYTEHCALVHPGRLVRGLASRIERMGARIYENSAVRNIRPGAVMTKNGEVRAKFIIRATEAYSCQMAEYHRSVIPLYSLVLATAPLPEALRARLRLRRHLAFNDMRHLRVYAQVTSDGRLVFGGRGAPYGFGSNISSENEALESVHAKILAAMLEFFPDLRDIEITHRWGGALGVARDWCPSVGIDRESGFVWGGGYVGDGVATSNLSGRIIRNLILRRDEAINSLLIVNHKSPLWEPEPFRWLEINTGLLAASLSDAEEGITSKPSRIAKILERITGAH